LDHEEALLRAERDDDGAGDGDVEVDAGGPTPGENDDDELAALVAEREQAMVAWQEAEQAAERAVAEAGAEFERIVSERVAVLRSTGAAPPLPMVVDDALAGMALVAAEQALRALIALSATQQVILLTDDAEIASAVSRL